MELAEIKSAVDSASEPIKAQLADLKAALSKQKEEFTALQKDGAKADELQKLALSIESLYGKLDEIELKGETKMNTKSFDEQIAESLTKNAESFSKMKNDKSTGNVLFDVSINQKAAATMTTANYSGGTIGLSTWDPVFTRVVRRQPFLRQIVTTRPVSSRYVAWAEQAVPDGGAAATAEGAAKSQADFDIVERNKIVEKITAYIKVSKESLDDISFLRSEINTELVELLSLKLDADILGANGTTPNIRGILDYATTYDPTGSVFADAIEQANNFDVVRAVVATLQNNSYMANYVLINPLDAGLMDMIKVGQTDGRYVLPPFASSNGQTIAGLQVITNPGVTAGTFVIGDFTKSNLGMREEINIQVGYENDDFTKNLVTILGELRAVHYIKTNHAGAFYKGTFATVAAALEKPNA